MEMMPERLPPVIAPRPSPNSASSQESLSRFLKALIARRSSSTDGPSTGALPSSGGKGESSDCGGSEAKTQLPPMCVGALS